METFSIRDLRERTGELVRGAESGKLALVTKRGRPIFLAVPFGEDLIHDGLAYSLAAKLFAEGHISSGKAARMAMLPLAEFLQKSSRQGIDAVDYEPDELDGELSVFD